MPARPSKPRIPPLSKTEVLRAVRTQRYRTLALVRPLSEDELSTPTHLPGWRVREVLAHLATTDRASVTGTILGQVFAGSTDRVERWNDRQVEGWRGRDGTDLIEALDTWGRRFLRFARLIPAAVYRLPIPTMFGGAPGGMLVWARAYDEWVHRQDIRRALRKPDEEPDPTMPAQFLLRAIGVSTMRRVRNERGRVAIRLEGARGPAWIYDLGRRTGWPMLGDVAADATVTAPAAAFMMAAADRDRFDDLIDDGRIKVEGDEDVARRFLAKIRIV